MELGRGGIGSCFNHDSILMDDVIDSRAGKNVICLITEYVVLGYKDAFSKADEGIFFFREAPFL